MFKVKGTEISHLFSKLNIAEQGELNKYINQKINKNIQECNKMIDDAKATLYKDKIEIKNYYFEKNEETWQRIETSIHVAMREYKISEERIKKIDARVKELNEGHELLLGEETKSKYKILDDADFAKLMELLMDSNCKNCHSRNNKCEVHGLLKKYNIPHEGKGKCKYSYLKIGKKVV